MFTTSLNKNQRVATICFALAAVTMILYWPITHHGFINYDDPEYIFENPHINSGLSWPNIVWAFDGAHAANWHPVTWMSHMADCQLFGVNPGEHHLVNVLFHIANTLLLFLLLNNLTGALWRSAIVAALFAWHPLHVESVAWASERKDVLSTFFWLLTLMAYVRYTRKPNIAAYCLALLLFTLGLMSKPMVVTLPFVLLLIDFWPLNRFTVKSIRFLILEKLPFFALAAAAALITCLSQKNAMWSSSSLPFHFRMANALISYLRYISKTFWPTDLALIYPYPHHWPLSFAIVAALLLAMWSGLFIWRAKQNPYLLIGWFWFLGTLVPAIGLVQTGVQSIADRYMYIPSIGLFIIVVWGLNDFLASRRQGQTIAALIGTLALGGCLVATSIQLRYWQNSVKLFTHTIKITTDNYAAYNCLGDTLEKLGHKDEALALYTESVRVEPDFPLGQFNLGMMLLENGKPDEAFAHLNAATQLMPNNPDLQYDLGIFLSQHGKPDEAINHFNAALKERNDFPEAHNGLGMVLLQQSKFDEAIAQFREAIRLKPDYTEAKNNLSAALAKQNEKQK